MTTLQETARDALEALERIGKDFVCRSAHHAKKDQHSAFAECPVVVRHTDAIEALRTALAQQMEQQPVCHGCGIPAGDVHMSTCKSGKWPSRVSNGDTAAPAPQAQQGKQQPVAYITQTEQGQMVWTPEMYDEACTYCDDGEFPVPLYTVTLRPTSGDYALGYAEGFNDACKPAPQAQPMTNPCKTCSHFQEGKLPGVRIHDETCYECRSYWGNKLEAA